jgi:hypothetical protein
MNVTALAVIVDSAVTLGVGYWLNRTAKKEVKEAVDNIGPVIRQQLEDAAEEYAKQAKLEIAKSIQKLVPVILKAVKNAGRTTATSRTEPEPITESVRTESSSDTN